MIKYIVIVILILFGLIWYFNNPILRLNRLYALNLSLNTEKVIWEENWSGNGNGSVVGLFNLNKEDSQRLSKRCQSQTSPFVQDNTISKYTYRCTIEYKKDNEDIISLVLVKDKENEYLFYKIVVQ